MRRGGVWTIIVIGPILKGDGMTSPKQIAANRRNARKSTGPKTAKGKARASGNAMKHGILAEDTVIEGEDRRVFEDLLGQLGKSLKPVGAMEEMLVSRIADCAWRLRRLRQFERRTFDRTLERLVAEAAQTQGDTKREQLLDERILTAVGEGRDLGEDYPKIMDEVDRWADAQVQEVWNPPEPLDAFWEAQEVMAVLGRYEVMMDRAMIKALHELQRLQAARQNGPAVAPMALDFNVEVDVNGDGKR